MHSKALALLTATVLLAGCAAPQKFSSTVPFDAEQARALLVDGSNSVRGSALIRQRAGGVVTCAGRDVALIPATTYADEKLNALYGNTERGFNRASGGKRLSAEGEPAEYRQLIRRTTCDAQGFFKFDKVADGSFYVVTAITWQVNDYVQEGGGLMQRVTLSGGNTKELVLAP